MRRDHPFLFLMTMMHRFRLRPARAEPILSVTCSKNEFGTMSVLHAFYALERSYAMPYDIPNRRSGRRMFLRKRETLTLNNAQGSVIAMDSGCLWITLERDLRDIILVPGMRFEIDRPGRTIVTAEEPSRFRVFVRDTAMHRLAALLRRIGGGVLHRWAGRL